MVLRGFAACGVAVILLGTVAADDTRQPIADETLQLTALLSIFPGMELRTDRNEKIDDSVSMEASGVKLLFPDALAGRTVYRVAGKAMNEAEECASADAITGRSSMKRRVRFELFRWPNEGELGLIAVLQYDFPHANPAMSCPSLGLLVHLIRENGDWAAKAQYLLETVHHHAIYGIRLMDLTGRGSEELVIESGFGGAGESDSSLQVFDLSRGRFDEVLATESWMSSWQTYTQVLDVDRTRANRGRLFCFSKTTYLEMEKTFRPPRITHPCYKRGEGVDSMQENKLLTPVRQQFFGIY